MAKVGQWRTPPHIQYARLFDFYPLLCRYINPNSVHKAPQLNSIFPLPAEVLIPSGVDMPDLTRQIPYSTPNYPIFTIPQRNNFQQPPKEMIPSSFPVSLVK